MSTHSSGYSVSEVSQMLGLTAQRVRQICLENPEACRKPVGVWRLEQDFVAKLVFEQAEKKLRRERKSGAAPELDLSDLTEATRRLADVLEADRDSMRSELLDLRKELRNAQESNAALRNELTELRHSMRDQGGKDFPQKDQLDQVHDQETEGGDYIFGSRGPRLRKNRDRTRRRKELD